MLQFNYSVYKQNYPTSMLNVNTSKFLKEKDLL